MPSRTSPASLAKLGMLLFASALTTQAGLVNRWSFNDPAGNVTSGDSFTDSISSEIATVQGALYNNSGSNYYATLDGSEITLPGGSHGNHSSNFTAPYIDLPDGLISNKTDLTVEIWATPIDVSNISNADGLEDEFTNSGFMRVFSFGSCDTTHGPGADPGELNLRLSSQPGGLPGFTNGVDYIYASFAVGYDGNSQRHDADITGSLTGGYVDSSNATTMGTEYHYVLTFEDGAGAYGPSGGQIKWYRDGVLVNTQDVDFQLSEMNDVNNWLGRSQWTADLMANASYNEVRIYDHALSTTEISDNLLAGPDSFTDPDTDDDGLLDLWEDEHFGNNNGNATQTELDLYDGDDDPDMDGYDNATEQSLGTDPNDDQSPPPGTDSGPPLDLYPAGRLQYG